MENAIKSTKINGINVINMTPHAINFVNDEGNTILVKKALAPKPHEFIRGIQALSSCSFLPTQSAYRLLSVII